MARGEGWFSPKIAVQIAAWGRGENRYGLTTRELDLLRLLVEGKGNREIAKALDISEKTVEKYLSGLFTKLRVTSRVEAAVLAVREGLV